MYGPCARVNKVTGVQECDARDDDQGTTAGNKKCQLL